MENLTGRELEQAIIGALLTRETECIEQLRDNGITLDARHFSNGKLRTIYSIIMELMGDGVGVDYLTVSERARERNLALKSEELASLGEVIASTVNFCEWVNILNDNHSKRELAKAIELAKNRLERGESWGEVATTLANHSLKISTTGDKKSLEEIKKPYGIDAIAKELREDISKGIECGITLESLGEKKKIPLKLPSGAVSVVAASSGHGKTSMLVNMALNISDRINKPIYFFSYEEHRAAIGIKFLNTFLNLEKENCREHLEDCLRASPIREHLDTAKINELNSKLEKSIKIIYDSYSTNELIGKIRMLHHQKEIGMIFIDYIQLLHDTDAKRAGTRQEELKLICKKLRELAVETGLPIVLASQFNREVKSLGDMDERKISEAGDIERVANLILGVYLERDDLGGQTLKVKVLKGRYIGSGHAATLDFNGNTGKISEGDGVASLGNRTPYQNTMGDNFAQ